MSSRPLIGMPGVRWREHAWRLRKSSWALYSRLEKWLYRHGRLSRDRLSLPDFVVIGAPQSGTTWLFENLRLHPQVFIPAVKELRYFESINSHLTLTHHYSRYFSPGASKVKGDISPGYSILPFETILYIRELLPDVRLIMIMRDPIDRTWAATRRVFSKALFRISNSGGLAIPFDLSRGIVSPYVRRLFAAKGCHLSDRVAVTVVNADAQWLIEDLALHQAYTAFKSERQIAVYVSTMRNRALFAEGRFSEVDDQPVISYMACEHQAKLNDYESILCNWLNAFPREQLLVLRFEDIACEPISVLREVFAHIGVSDSINWNDFPYSTRINRNPDLPLPVKYRTALKEIYREQIRAWRDTSQARCAKDRKPDLNS